MDIPLSELQVRLARNEYYRRFVSDFRFSNANGIYSCALANSNYYVFTRTLGSTTDCFSIHFSIESERVILNRYQFSCQKQYVETAIKILLKGRRKLTPLNIVSIASDFCSNVLILKRSKMIFTIASLSDRFDDQLELAV